MMGADSLHKVQRIEDERAFNLQKYFSDPALYNGELAILFDSTERAGKGRGIFLVSAMDTTADDACIMAIQGRGVLTVTLDASDALRLGLGVQGRRPADTRMPYYALSVEALSCSETGISAAERALTMRVVGAQETNSDNLTSPGHVMVQVVRDTFREMATLPELGYRLLSVKGQRKAAGWCDILGDDGDHADFACCQRLANDFSLPLFNARDIDKYSRHPYRTLEQFSSFTYSSFG